MNNGELVKNEVVRMVKNGKNTQHKKIYILDTNVLLYDPHALFAFAGLLVGIPSVVLEELDRFKGEGSDRGRNTREVIRHLDELRSQGSLKEGITLDNGSILKVFFAPQGSLAQLPFDMSLEDNVILLIASELKKEGYDIVFISKDLNARVKADALGIFAQDYLKEHVTEHAFYKGWVRIQVPAVQFKKDIPPELANLIKANALIENQFILVESKHNPYNYRVYRYLGGKKFKQISDTGLRWPLQPRNPQQIMALDVLLDETIQFVTLLGPAGTGKTFLALLAGLHQVLIDDTYQKMLISRPVIPLGRDIGYLPGDVREKLQNWMLPIYDNMDFIIHSVNIGQHFQELETTDYRRKEFRDKHRKKKSMGLMPLDDLISRGKVSMEAITYMRGRSIPYQYILIDEAQNLTPHEVKTLISRAGEGSKIILAGDPYQIDSPYIDFSSNGLVVASEKFKGQKIFSSVFLETSERSELSKLVGTLL